MTDITALRALLAAGTPGEADGTGLVAATGKMHMVGPPVDGDDYDARSAQIRADAALWNGIRAQLPELLDEVERLRAIATVCKHKLGYLLRDYPGDKETAGILAAIRDEAKGVK